MCLNGTSFEAKSKNCSRVLPGQSMLKLIFLLCKLCFQISDLSLQICNLLLQVIALSLQLPLGFLQLLSGLLLFLQADYTSGNTVRFHLASSVILSLIMSCHNAF